LRLPAPLVDFLLPSAQVRFKGPRSPAVFHAAFGPPSGFGYPLDGLLPLNPSDALSRVTALLGFSPSKHSLCCRGVTVSPRRRAPLAVCPAYNTRIGILARLRRPRLLGPYPAVSPAVVMCPKAPLVQVAPLGFCLSRAVPPTGLDPAFARSPLMRLAVTRSSYQPTLQSLDRPATGEGCRSRGRFASLTTLLRFLHLSAPLH
jgi:hypothetical protein